MDQKPMTITPEWVDSDAEESVGEQITKRGQHHLQNFVERKRQENAERRAKYTKDYHGDIPPPEAQLSTRTWKSSSQIRYPSRLYRERYALIDWGR